MFLAGLYIYLVSKWAPQAKTDFYKIHRYLGSATLLAGFAAIIMGLAEDQIFLLWSTGVETFFSPAAYNIYSMIIPLLGYLLFLLALAVMVQFVIFDEQVLPAPASAKEGAI